MITSPAVAAVARITRAPGDDAGSYPVRAPALYPTRRDGALDQPRRAGT